MIKLQPFKTAMPARPGTIAWQDAVILFDCVGRRQAFFNGTLGTETPLGRRTRNRFFATQNRKPPVPARPAETDHAVNALAYLFSAVSSQSRPRPSNDLEERMLFVGGPENGQYHYVPRGYRAYLIPVRKLPVFADSITIDQIAEEPYKVYKYERRRSQAFTEFMEFVE